MEEVRLDIQADMLSSLLRPQKARRRVEESPLFTSPYAGHAAADFTEDDEEDEHTEDEDDQDEGGDEEDEEEMTEGEEGEDGDSHSPLLPIFSAAHLGSLSHCPIVPSSQGHCLLWYLSLAYSA